MSDICSRCGSPAEEFCWRCEERVLCVRCWEEYGCCDADEGSGRCPSEEMEETIKRLRDEV